MHDVMLDIIKCTAEALSKTPPHDKDVCELHRGEEVLSMKFVSYDDTPEVLQPGEQPFNLPSAPVAPQRPAVLGFCPLFSIRGNHFNTPVLFQLGVKLAAVAGRVSNEPFRELVGKARWADIFLKKFAWANGQLNAGSGERIRQKKGRNGYTVRK